MQTSCPECRTTFRVTQTQLGLRRGLVRCGQCNAVFNAYDTLLPELEEPPIQPRPPILDALSDSAALPELRLPGLLDAEPDVEAEETEEPEAPERELPFTPEPAPDLLSEEPYREATSSPEIPTAAEDEAHSEADTPEAILLSELPNRQAAQAVPSRGKRLAYGLAAGFLIVLLGLQLAVFLRAEIVAVLPASRPALEGLCAPFGCKVPLPRELGKNAIGSSNLEHDTEQKSRVRLTVLLANRTGQTQAWPHLSLTLTDIRETPVAQKLFPPESYLPPDTRIAAGMAKGSEREVLLDLDIGNLAATGYALSLVYP